MTTVVAVEPKPEPDDSDGEGEGVLDDAEPVPEPLIRVDGMRAETITVCLKKKVPEDMVGLEVGMAADSKWVIITKVNSGSLCEQYKLEIKPGAKLLDVKVNGVLTTVTSPAQAKQLISSAKTELELTIMPILDRYGFIISQHEFKKSEISREQVRKENIQIMKWQKRVSSEKAWREYAARKPDKLKDRIRSGVPDAVRGFVWKLLAQARVPKDFRQPNLFMSLLLREEELPCFALIDKDVPRTMNEHIYYRGNGSRGPESLTRVLRAYAQYKREIGYTQGMSHFAAVLLLYMTEEDAFWTFATLMQHCGLALLFQEGFPLLFHSYEKWQTLLQKRDPKLAKHIMKEQLAFQGFDPKDLKELPQQTQLSLTSGMYTTMWFQGMYVGAEHPAPSAMAPRIMDNILLDGNLAIIYQIGLALLASRRAALLKLDSDQLCEALKMLPKNCDDIERTMQAAYESPVKAKQIEHPATLGGGSKRERV